MLNTFPPMVPTRPSGDDSNAPATTAYVVDYVTATVSTAVAGIGVFSSASNGLVPASSNSSAAFLRGDATWATPATQAQTVLQFLQTVNTSTTSMTAPIPLDNTTPLSTEGTQILSQAITPASTISKVFCEVSFLGSINAVSEIDVSMFRDTTCIQAASNMVSAANRIVTFSFNFLDSPTSTASVTYSVRAGPPSSARTVYLNANSLTGVFGGTASCTLTLTEVSTA